MTTTELILNMLAETGTKDIANATHPQGLEENKKLTLNGRITCQFPYNKNDHIRVNILSVVILLHLKRSVKILFI